MLNLLITAPIYSALHFIPRTIPNFLYSLTHSTFTTTLWWNLYNLYSWANWGMEGLSYSLEILHTTMVALGLRFSSKSQRPQSPLLPNAKLYHNVHPSIRVFLPDGSCQVSVSPPDSNNQVLPQETLALMTSSISASVIQVPQPSWSHAPEWASWAPSDFESQMGDTSTERAKAPWSDWSLIFDNWTPSLGLNWLASHAPKTSLVVFGLARVYSI